MADKKETALKLPKAGIDKVIDHRGMYGTESLCRVRIFWHAIADVVLLTETLDNSGGFLHSCITNIAGIVAKQYELNPERTIWIGHDSPTGRDRVRPREGKETFDLVEMHHDPALKLLISRKQRDRVLQTPFIYPKWNRLTPTKVLEVILTGRLD